MRDEDVSGTLPGVVDGSPQRTGAREADSAWRGMRGRLTGALLAGLGVLSACGAVESFDRAALLSLREASDLAQPVGPRWLLGVVRDLSALGSSAVLNAVIVFTLGALVIERRLAAARFFAVAAWGGMILGWALKLVFRRPRPDVVPHLLGSVESWSFPSGHALDSAAVYLAAALAVGRLGAGGALRRWAIGFALVLAFLVGGSRVFLGVHYPSDVVAGWTIGLAWIAVCSRVGNRPAEPGRGMRRDGA